MMGIHKKTEARFYLLCEKYVNRKATIGALMSFIIRQKFHERKW